MKMIKCLLVACAFLGACNRCHDEKFFAKFENTIKTLERLKSGGISLQNTVDSIRIASQIITVITNVKPQISYNYTVAYTEEKFSSDTAKWYKWYSEHKCKVTEDMFDQLPSQGIGPTTCGTLIGCPLAVSVCL